VSFLSLLAVCWLPYTLQILAGIFDFAILAGYIASAVLLADDFHARADENPLRNRLVYIRTASGESSARAARSAALVRLLAGAVVVMILLFFFSTLLSCWLATLSMHEHYVKEHAADVEEAR